eukprot:CAMPEP_0206431350 /NCGR_PEP_ID=MMETSP0324_2-20121206/7313_1 /ASSEMBLY_ACC=CAM_ASM_000836 /TAXON_ID=2866 /ORGANISM="Crypthecodinium cohnii, Strain Seligo" /LENGTH=168 /DNA_ID=CAMNT_0053897263 /DNA_START=79 /DNA_END=585 /DNA_ORIENTATION=-
MTLELPIVTEVLGLCTAVSGGLPATRGAKPPDADQLNKPRIGGPSDPPKVDTPTGPPFHPLELPKRDPDNPLALPGPPLHPEKPRAGEVRSRHVSMKDTIFAETLAAARTNGESSLKLCAVLTSIPSVAPPRGKTRSMAWHSMAWWGRAWWCPGPHRRSVLAVADTAV